MKPKMLSVGDSYYQGFLYNLTLDLFFDTHPYWYYNKVVHDDPLHGDVQEVDMLKELLSSDMVMLIYSPCNLYDLNRGFLTKALFSFYFEDEVVEAKFEKIKQDIKNTPEWYASIEQEALKNGQEVDQVLEANAQYMLYGSPGIYFDEFNHVEVPACRNSRVAEVFSQVRDAEREKLRKQILGDQEWLDAIRGKAAASQITVDEAIEKDIDWLIREKGQD